MSTSTISTTGLPIAITAHVPLYQVGRIVVQTACTARPLADWALEISCGATVTNNSFRPVIVTAQLIATTPAAAHSTMQLGPVTWTLSPNKSITIPAPPAGYDWVIVDFSESQARTLGWLVIGGLAIGTGFAGYGLYAATANLIGWAKRHHAQERSTRK